MVTALDDDLVLYELLDVDDYKYIPERGIVFEIDSYAWNCTLPVLPPYSGDDIEPVFNKQQQLITALKDKIKLLERDKIKQAP